MNSAAIFLDDNQYSEESVVSSKQWVWPPHSEFGSDQGQVIQFLKNEPSSIPAPTKCMIKIPGATPDWASEVASKFASIMQLSENWDSYGAKEVTINSIFSAIQLLVAVMKQAAPMPAIVPTPVGGVQLEWHKFGIDLEAEILPSGHYFLAYEDEVLAIEMFEEESSSRPAAEIVPLLSYINVLTQRAANTEA